MAVKHKAQPGQLYEQAGQFAAALEANQKAAVDQVLAAWTDAYWGIRQEMDVVLAKIASAQAEGIPVTPGWLYQKDRLKALLNTTKAEMGKYAVYASEMTTAAQKAAVAAGVKHAQKMGATALAESLPGFTASMIDVNPEVLQHLVGFLGDGSVLANHLQATMPYQAAKRLEQALIQGVARGKSQAWMLAHATKALGITHGRAETILRTESLRAYRAASRATYLANQDVLGTWVWNAHLDSRTCVACAVMDGTEHPLDATLDGHPRCRCAMVPRTKSWEELGVAGVADTRPPVRSGKAWLEDQSPSVQRAIMGPAKFKAWTAGDITLDDMVARTYSPKWGTMRSERSLKSIAEDVNANWHDTGAALPPVPEPVPQPNMAVAQGLADDLPAHALQAVVDGDVAATAQEVADAVAALAYQQAKAKPLLGAEFPTPVPAKVKTYTDLLETQYKAHGPDGESYLGTLGHLTDQATGPIGQPTGGGVILDWQAKVNAQATLAAWEERKAALEAGEKVAANVKAEAANAITAAGNDTAAVAWFSEQIDTAQAAVKSLTSMGLQGTPLAKAEARLKALKAAEANYLKAQEAMKGYQGHWVNGGPTYLDVDETGWAVLASSVSDVTIVTQPEYVFQMLTKANAGWTKAAVIDQEKVTLFLNGLKGPDGLIDPSKYESFKSTLASGLVDPDVAPSIKEAMDQAWGTMKWKPEAHYVAQIKDALETGADTEAALVAKLQDPATKPLSKANISEALTQWRAEQAAKAATSIPVPKPVIDPAKFDWAKASEAQVAKIKAKVDSGEWTLDDVYALYQKSKNKGPKTNYAKAILEMEGKDLGADVGAWPDSIPGANQDAYSTLYEEVVDGYTTVEELTAYTKVSTDPGVKAAAQQVLLDLHDEGKIGEKFLEDAGIPKVTKVGPTQVKVTPKPAPAPPTPKALQPPWKPEDLTNTGKVLGTHGAQVWEAPDGTRWLFKPPKDPKDGFLVTLDEAASRLQAQVGLKAPDTYTVTLGGRRGSIQRMFEATDAFPGGLKPEALTTHDLEAVQRQHVLDWLLSNHDGHRDQFLRLPNGDLVGIDKGQAFRWFGQDRLDWEFHPNQAYGAPEPVYNTLWRSFANGGNVTLEHPSTGALAKAIADVQAVSDDALREMFRPYAEEAAARGLLAKAQTFPGLTKATVPANDVEAFLDALVARKHNLDKDFTDLYARAAKARQQAIPGWKPTAPPKTGKAKWHGKDKPPTPTPPPSPEKASADVFDGWLGKVKAKYEAFSGGKSLEASNNWARVRRVIENRDPAAIQELLDRHYLDDDLAAEAHALIAKAEQKAKAAEAAYKRAQADYEDALRRWKKDLADWRDANGIKDLTQGMEEGVLRHESDADGDRWARSIFKEEAYSDAQRAALKTYTGSAFDNWNTHLRTTKGNPTEYLQSIKRIDKAMPVQVIPEDVILHRGTTAAQFPGFTGNLEDLVGAVFTDHGYMSTSVGNSAAFAHKPVQMKIRAPAGTPGAYVNTFSQFGSESVGGGERELILSRDTTFFIHAVYQKNGKTIVECEIVPRDFDAAHATPRGHSRPWSH